MKKSPIIQIARLRHDLNQGKTYKDDIQEEHVIMTKEEFEAGDKVGGFPKRTHPCIIEPSVEELDKDKVLLTYRFLSRLRKQEHEVLDPRTERYLQDFPEEERKEATLWVDPITLRPYLRFH